MPKDIQIRQVKYLNNIVEQDHHFITKLIRLVIGLKPFRTAKRISAGIEARYMIKKGQTLRGKKSVQSHTTS
ncbi:hypothetical protein BC359_20715 (plasmid) [Priestia flexa]|nr:hypothetical protein BC359_20715 [Priestia flexa]